MNSFSISQLSRFSGIQPHTIRAWETRYQALRPTRSEGNTRYYDGNQLRRLLNMVSLAGLGYKISDLARLEDENLQQMVLEIYLDKQEGLDEAFISQMIGAAMNYDEQAFEKPFGHCILKYGMAGAYRRVLYPLVERIGILWTADQFPPAQEHFISNLLRQKLFTAIDFLPVPESTVPPWILFLPENEFHEIGLLFAHYMLRAAGQNSIYLGSGLPFESLRQAVKETRPEYLLFFMVHKDDPLHTKSYLKELNSIFRKTIYIAGEQEFLQELKPSLPFRTLSSVDELEKEILLSKKKK